MENGTLKGHVVIKIFEKNHHKCQALIEEAESSKGELAAALYTFTEKNQREKKTTI